MGSILHGESFCWCKRWELTYWELWFPELQVLQVSSKTPTNTEHSNQYDPSQTGNKDRTLYAHLLKHTKLLSLNKHSPFLWSGSCYFTVLTWRLQRFTHVYSFICVPLGSIKTIHRHYAYSLISLQAQGQRVNLFPNLIPMLTQSQLIASSENCFFALGHKLPLAKDGIRLCKTVFLILGELMAFGLGSSQGFCSRWCTSILCNRSGWHLLQWAIFL